MKKMVAAVSVILFILFAAFVYRASVFRISQNFSVVDADKLYRSAQLTDDELTEIVKKYQIKTVISLRGSPGPTMFYGVEADVLKKLGVHFEVIGMSDEYYPHQDEIKQLLTAYQTAQYPILIHCRVGADRTGMAAALYKKVILKTSDAEAMDELSFRFWHVTAFHPAMNDFVKKAKDVAWAMNEYDVCKPEFNAYRKPANVCP